MIGRTQQQQQQQSRNFLRYVLSVVSIPCLILVGCQAEETTVGTGTSTGVLEKKWGLYHSIGGRSNNGEWIRRGTVSLRIDPIALDTNDYNGDSSNSQKKKKDDEDDHPHIQLQVENDDACLSETALQSLKDSHWYKLKLVEEAQDAEEDQGGSSLSVITSVSACQVRRANFRDEFVLTFGSMGHVVSLAYMPLVSPLAPKTCEELDRDGDDDEKKDVHFTSRISYETAVPGMTLRTVLPNYQPPPGLKFITKSRTISSTATQEMDGSKGSKDDARSTSGGFGVDDEDDSAKIEEDPLANSPFGFFRRYWYILVPLMIMNFMGKVEEPPEQQQEGQQVSGGQQQQVQTGGGGTTAAMQQQHQQQAPARGETNRKRRGKRVH